ncbi:MAG TPA: hypothetical protein VJK02_03700 [Anaerolineales bacterium]|nr:hypothetical protein [Anaerolineales bacterium]
MTGERALSKIQWGKESAAAHGTAVAADTILAGAEISAINPDRKPSYYDDALGVRMRSTRSVIYQYLAQNTIKLPACYFQLLPMLFSCGLLGNISPAEQTPSQNDMLWTFLPSLTGDNVPDSITLEMGDDTQAYEAEYLMFESIKLAGQIAQGADESPVSAEAAYFARQVTPTTFTGGLSLPSMETMNAKLSRFYVNTTWAARGTTEKTGTIRAWELEFLTGLHPKFLGSADKFFDIHGQSFIEAMLTLTLEGNANADALFDYYQAGTKIALGLKVSGALIGTGVAHSLAVNLWGMFEHVTALSEEVGGNNLHKALFHAMYDPTGAHGIEAKVITSVAGV